MADDLNAEFTADADLDARNRAGQPQIAGESGYLGPDGDLSGSGAQLTGLPIAGPSLHRIRNGPLVDGEGNALLFNDGVMTRASARARALTSDSR